MSGPVKTNKSDPSSKRFRNLARVFDRIWRYKLYCRLHHPNVKKIAAPSIVQKDVDTKSDLKRKKPWDAVSINSKRQKNNLDTHPQVFLRSIQWAYVYVPKSDVDTIMQYGYLSAREQVNLLPHAAEQLIQKYKHQYEAHKHQVWANQVPPDDMISCILAYLDWREEHTSRGSNAIYFMYAPIPEVCAPFIREQRRGFLTDRVLLRFPLHMAQPIYTVGTQETPLQLFNKTNADWEHIWNTSLNKHQNNKHVLWLQDIPHAYIVPARGCIPANELIVCEQNYAV